MHSKVQIIELLQGLLGAIDNEQDAALEKLLHWLCRETGFDCALQFQLVGADVFHCTQYSGVTKTPSDWLQIQIKASDADILLRGESPLILCRDTHPLQGPLETALLQRGLGTVVLVPIRTGAKLVGFISFGIGDPTYKVLPDTVALLSSTTKLIGSALGLRLTERQSIEVASRLTTTLDALPNLVFEVDANGRYTGFMAGPEHLMAASKESLTGNTLYAMLPPDAAKVAAQALQEVIATGRASDVHFKLELADGPHDFELTGTRKSASGTGQPSAIFLIRDVTKETRLREEMQNLGKIVELMDNLVVITDVQSQITWVNAAFETQTGWRLDEIIGKNLDTLLRCADSDPATVAQVSEAIAAHKTFKGDIINQDRFGRKYWVDFNIWPLFAETGQLRGYVSVETVVTRLKEQEAAVKELAAKAAAAQTRLENALMALPDGVLVLDADERVIAINAAYHRTFPELSEIAVSGISLTKLLQAELTLGLVQNQPAASDMDAFLQQRLANFRKPKHLDEVQLHNGKWLRRISMQTADGGCIALAIDITGTKKHLAALDAVNGDLVKALQDRDAVRQRLLRIMDGADIGTWEWDVIGDDLKVGGRWGEIIGLETRTHPTLNSDKFRSFVHPDDLKVMDKSQAVDLGKENVIITHEFRMKHREGHWVWILSRSRVTKRGADGKASVIVGVHIDISDRKRLEQELLTSQTYLTHIMETNVAAVAVLTAEGTISFANSEAERVLGLSRSQILGRKYHDTAWRLERVDGSPLPESELPFTRAMAEGLPVRDMTFALHWPDGNRRVLSCSAAPLRVSDGRIEVVTTFSDITDQVAATVQLEDALSKAEEMSRAKSIFLANMSHEIRTPLNGVLGMAEVLEALLTEPSQKRMIKTIRKSGDTLLTVLNGVLDMSKLEAGKMALEEAAFSPLELAQQTQAIYAIQAEEKGLYLETFFSVGCEKFWMGDSHRINQIMNNLLNNAVKFTELGGVQMKMTCRPGKPFVIEISDTGIGMDAQQVARVFENFEQADVSTTRRFSGTGLGLSIVRQLVKLMGGDISVSSKVGAGTKIRVTLPLSEVEPSASQLVHKTDKDFTTQSLAGVRMLFADDNRVNLLVLKEMLSHTGAVITEAENGQLAFDAWAMAVERGKPFAMLLLDITMPVCDGLSALTEIRAAETAKGLRAVPAIAVTANAMSHQIADYIMGGFSTHLAKPIKQVDLFHAINTILAEKP